MTGRRLAILILAFAGAALLGACGRGAANRASPPVGDRTNLRSPDVDARMDPASHGVFACPRVGRIEVVFDPHGTVAVFAGPRPLVYGTAGTRAVNRACPSQGALPGIPHGALRERTKVTRLSCSLPGSPRFEVHPITAAGRDVGSTVAVLERNLRTIVLSAVLEPEGSRIYYGRPCRIA